MTSSSDKVNLLGLPKDALERFIVSLDEKPFRARQILKWIYQQGVLDFNAMTDLSKSLRSKLQTSACVGLPVEEARQDSADGTIKWLFSSGSGQAVETVFIPETARGTLCISSQVGCALDCAFCATGAQGFNRNLTAAEIIGQAAGFAKIHGLASALAARRTLRGAAATRSGEGVPSDTGDTRARPGASASCG